MQLQKQSNKKNIKQAFPLKNFYVLIFCLGLVILLIILYSFKASKQTDNSVPSFSDSSGKIIVQLIGSPGFMFPTFNGIPEWTLYGDGRLVYMLREGDTYKFLEARLAKDDINHILDVIVNQHHFFSSTKSLYGKIIPDAGTTILNVSVNGKQQQAELGIKPEGFLTDNQTNDIFAIENFLQNYKPSVVKEYIAPGAIVLVQQTQALADRVWPYNDISLSQIVTGECPLFSTGASCTIPKEQASLFAIIGLRGTNLLKQHGFQTVSQGGAIYQLIAWPLMPDAMNIPHQVLVAQSGGLTEWPLSLIGE